MVGSPSARSVSAFRNSFEHFTELLECLFPLGLTTVLERVPSRSQQAVWGLPGVVHCHPDHFNVFSLAMV